VLIFMSLVLTTSASALASDTLTVLSSFNGEAGYGGSGYSPMGDLVFDSAGNLSLAEVLTAASLTAV
jgi:hypothetical protein